MIKKELVVLLLIMAVAGWFRWWDLAKTPPGLYPDEAMNGNNAMEAARTGDYQVFYPENNGREGLFINIQALTLKLLPYQEAWVLRLPSTIFGWLTVLVLYLMVRELFDKHPQRKGLALLAAFLLAVSFWHINFSRIGFRAIMAPFFLTAAMWLWLAARRRGHLWLAAGSGLMLGLGAHSYIAYRIMPALGIIFLPKYWREGRFWKQAGVAAVAALITASPLLVYFYQNPADFLGRTAQISVFDSPTAIHDLARNIVKTAVMFNFVGDGNWRHNLAGEAQLYWPVGVMFLIGLAYSWTRLYKQDSEKYLVLLGWLFLAMVPVVISNEGLPHALRAILMIPPVYVLAAVGGWLIYERLIKLGGRQYQKTLAGVAILFLLTFIGNTHEKYFIRWGESRHTYNAFSSNYVELGREINALPKAMPKYIIVESGGVLVRDIPMPAQTVMFITDSFDEKRRREQNIYYLRPEEAEIISDGAWVRKI